MTTNPFECVRCGYSKFVYASEFHDGDPLDQTRICDDCGMPETTCQWFALCTNPATDLVPHPILGSVPACERCKVLALRDRYEQPVDPPVLANWHGGDPDDPCPSG